MVTQIYWNLIGLILSVLALWPFVKWHSFEWMTKQSNKRERRIHLMRIKQIVSKKKKSESRSTDSHSRVIMASIDVVDFTLGWNVLFLFLGHPASCLRVVFHNNNNNQNPKPNRHHCIQPSAANEWMSKNKERKTKFSERFVVPFNKSVKYHYLSYWDSNAVLLVGGMRMCSAPSPSSLLKIVVVLAMPVQWK